LIDGLLLAEGGASEMSGVEGGSSEPQLAKSLKCDEYVLYMYMTILFSLDNSGREIF